MDISIKYINDNIKQLNTVIYKIKELQEQYITSLNVKKNILNINDNIMNKENRNINKNCIALTTEMSDNRICMSDLSKYGIEDVVITEIKYSDFMNGI